MLSAALNRYNYASHEYAAEDCAIQIAMRLEEAVQADGRAVLAVAASPSTEALLTCLSYADISWPAVTVTILDEFWQPSLIEPPREQTVRRCLLQNKAAAARFVGLYVKARTTDLAAFSASARIQHLKRPFDCVILNMDSKGQVAGLYRESSRLSLALNRQGRALVVPNYVKALSQTYLALTLPLIATAKFTFLPLTGQDKLITLEEAMQDGEAHIYPIQAILQAVTRPIEVYYAEK